MVLTCRGRTSCVPEFDDARREKQEVARVLKAARQAELKANAESATVSHAVLGRSAELKAAMAFTGVLPSLPWR